jgi:hypothetical protein
LRDSNPAVANGGNFIAGSHPDFTSSGAPIMLGFIQALNTTGHPSTLANTVGTDNWNVEIELVPEPSRMALLGLGWGVLSLRRRRTQGG